MMKTETAILIAEDDPDDRLLVQEALRESKFENPIFFVKDGEELLDYLYQRGKFSPPTAPHRPGLILLDLNMPRKDGREALAEVNYHRLEAGGFNLRLEVA